MSISWTDEDDVTGDPVHIVNAPGFPAPEHPAEPDIFTRHQGIPAHNQECLSGARVLIVGAGGLGGWAAVALARSGVRSLTIVDHDLFDRSNANRQFMFGCDIRRSKAARVAENLAPHMIAGGVITAVNLRFTEAVERYALSADVMAVLVDNNNARLEAVRFARSRGIPAVFSMLSLESMRIHTFLQGASADDPCLWCALPNLAAASSAACASAVITSCFTSAAHVTFFIHRALMGWSTALAFNWRASDLLGIAPEQIGLIRRLPRCAACGV